MTMPIASFAATLQAAAGQAAAGQEAAGQAATQPADGASALDLLADPLGDPAGLLERIGE